MSKQNRNDFNKLGLCREETNSISFRQEPTHYENKPMQYIEIF